MMMALHTDQNNHLIFPSRCRMNHEQMKTIFCSLSFVFCLMTSTNLLQAHWAVTSGPTGGYFRALTVAGPNVVAGTYGGMYVSSDNGARWTEISTGLAHKQISNLAVNGKWIFASGSTLYEEKFNHDIH
jgi:hypothetical protein